MRRVLRTLLLGALLSTLGLLGLAAPASAHNTLVNSDPAGGASLPRAPEQVSLTFDQTVQAGEVNQIAVTGPQGKQWAEGPVEVHSNVITAKLRPLGPAGEYTLGYRILSADGHAVPGEVRFTLTQPGTGTPASGQGAHDASAPASTGSETGTASGGVPIWVWVGGAVVLLAVGLTIALRMGRDAS